MSGSSTDDTLSLNADVTINNLDSTSSGSLLVKGSTEFENYIDFNSGAAANRQIHISGSAGTSGYVLTSGGSSGSISWTAPSGDYLWLVELLVILMIQEICISEVEFIQMILMLLVKEISL